MIPARNSRTILHELSSAWGKAREASLHPLLSLSRLGIKLPTILTSNQTTTIPSDPRDSCASSNQRSLALQMFANMGGLFCWIETALGAREPCISSASRASHATSTQVYTRDADLAPASRYSIIATYAICSGVLMMACIVLMIALCDLRTKYLLLRKDFDDIGFSLQQRMPSGQEPEAAGAEVQETSEVRTPGAA